MNRLPHSLLPHNLTKSSSYLGCNWCAAMKLCLIKRLCLLSFFSLLTACQFGVNYTGDQRCHRNVDSQITQQIVYVFDGQGRSTKLWLGLPKSKGKTPYIVFSHGAYSSPDRYEALLKPLVQAGYIVVAPWHIDSEDVEKKQTLTPEKNWFERRADIALLIAKPKLLKPYLKPLGLIIDTSSIGLLGHSYGGITVQAKAGAYVIDPADGKNKTEFDSRVRAVVAYSPPGAVPSFVKEDAWQNLRVPSMVVSGTKDILPGFIDNWREHLDSYYGAPAGQNWAFVGLDVDHYFGKRIGRLDTPDPKQSDAFELSLDTSILFMDAYLKSDDKAVECLILWSGNSENSPFFNLLKR